VEREFDVGSFVALCNQFVGKSHHRESRFQPVFGTVLVFGECFLQTSVKQVREYSEVAFSMRSPTAVFLEFGLDDLVRFLMDWIMLTLVLVPMPMLVILILMLLVLVLMLLTLTLRQLVLVSVSVGVSVPVRALVHLLLLLLMQLLLDCLVGALDERALWTPTRWHC